MSWWPWPVESTADRDSNGRNYSAQENDEAETLSQDGVFVLRRAGDAKKVAILKTPVDVSYPTSNDVQNSTMHTKAKSWSGGDAKFSPQSGTPATFSEVRKETEDMKRSSRTSQIDDLRSNDHMSANNSVNISGHLSPIHGASHVPATASEHPKINGQRERQKKRRRSRVKGKEAKLERLFWKDLTSRATVAEKRRELRRARRAVEQADEGLMKLIRKRRAQHLNGMDEDFLELENHYQQLQAARNQYGSIEESYDAMEERLDEHDYEITKLAEELQDNETEVFTKSEYDELDVLSRAPGDDRSSGINDAETDEDLYDEYMSRLGDANQVREDINELNLELRRLQLAQLSRYKADAPLSENDQAILEDICTRQAKFMEKLRSIELDAERLKNLCKEAGLLSEQSEDSERSEGKKGDSDILADLDELVNPKNEDERFNRAGKHGGVLLDEKTNTLEDLNSMIAAGRDRYSVLLGQSSEELDRKTKSLISDFDPQNPGDRIARWILHRLRSSYCEVELLERISAENGLDPPADMDKWQEDVLQFWFLDSTSLPPSAYQVQDSPAGLDVSSSPSPVADRDNKALLNSGQAHLIQLVIRSFPSFDKLEFALLLRLNIPKGGAAKSV